MSEFDQQDMDQKDTNQNNGSNSSKEKEKEYEDVCFVCRRPVQRPANIPAMTAMMSATYAG